MCIYIFLGLLVIILLFWYEYLSLYGGYIYLIFHLLSYGVEWETDILKGIF